MAQLTLDFSDYDGSQKHRHIMSSAEKFPVATRRLKNGFVALSGIDKLVTNRVARGKSKFFVQHKITTTDEGARFIKNYENWHVLTICSKTKLKDKQKINDLTLRLDSDCVGAQDRPNEDPNLFHPPYGNTGCECGRR